MSISEGLALGCDRLSVPQHHPATSSNNLLQICLCHHHTDGGAVECRMLLCFHGSAFPQWRKTTAPSRMGHAMVSSWHRGRTQLGSTFQPRRNAVGPRAQRQPLKSVPAGALGSSTECTEQEAERCAVRNGL